MTATATPTSNNPELFEHCIFYMDGDKWCCVDCFHVDLQTSPAGFGDTQEEAYQNYVEDFNRYNTPTTLTTTTTTNDEPFIGGHNED